jgi:hypothetical protein
LLTFKFPPGARSKTKKPREIILGFQLPGQPVSVYTTPAARYIKVVVGVTTKKVKE